MGFSHMIPGYDEVEKAIEKAYAKDVLIFAAASNGGGNNGRAYPAREKLVFCIHSTDARGNRSKFSPTAEDRKQNFATIGEAVESLWRTSSGESDEKAVRVKSGTSFATPIAASIAAFLLLYARVNLMIEPSIAKRLKKNQHMERLLVTLSEKSVTSPGRDGYQYISLSRHPDNFFGREVEAINYDFRQIAQSRER